MTPSRIVQTCAKRASKDLPVAFARAEYFAHGDDAVARFKEFRRLGVPILKIRKQAREEIADAGETEINIAVRKAWNNFPTHVRREHLADDFGVSARFIKPTDNSAIFFAVVISTPIGLPFRFLAWMPIVRPV